MDKREYKTYGLRLIVIFLLVFLYSCGRDTVLITYIEDGDTFYTSSGEKIRLEQVDAPEVEHRNFPAQNYGYKAKELAETYLLNQNVTIIRHGRDKYGRTLVSVYTPKGDNFEEILITNGLAHTTLWTVSSKLKRDYIRVKNHKIGLFQDSHWEYPYIYRRKYKIR